MEELKEELSALVEQILAIRAEAGVKLLAINRAAEEQCKPLNTRKAEINRIFEQAEFDALQPPDGLEWGAELVEWGYKKLGRWRSDNTKTTTGVKGVLVKARSHEVRAYYHPGHTAAVRILKKDGTPGKVVVKYSSNWRLPEGAK
jgi:hypothetical protein